MTVDSTTHKLVFDVEVRLRDTIGLTYPEMLRLLGVSKTSWHEYKAGTRDMPDYVRRSIKAHLACRDLELEQLAEDAEKESLIA